MTPAISASGMTPAPDIVYPESDGKPMADNTKQARWIVVLYDNLKALFWDQPDVFVAMNLLWYPLKGEDEERMAPDVMVVFGRPRGDRGSYKQWEEEDKPATVVFEILSPGNEQQEMDDKLVLYEHYGVEEYYLYDPERNRLDIRIRNRSALLRVHQVESFVSPRLGIRFAMTRPEMTVFRPNGERFLEFEDLHAERLRQEQRANREQQRADKEKQRADDAIRRADDEKRRADDEKRRADEADRLRRRQTELSRKVRQGQASAQEQAELDRLEAEST